jgi:hypothetical protein
MRLPLNCGCVTVASQVRIDNRFTVITRAAQSRNDYGSLVHELRPPDPAAASHTDPWLLTDGRGNSAQAFHL